MAAQEGKNVSTDPSKRKRSSSKTTATPERLMEVCKRKKRNSCCRVGKEGETHEEICRPETAGGGSGSGVPAVRPMTEKQWQKGETAVGKPLKKGVSVYSSGKHRASSREGRAGRGMQSPSARRKMCRLRGRESRRRIYHGAKGEAPRSSGAILKRKIGSFP